MSRFTTGLKLLLLFVFCAAGVKGQANPLAHCMEIINYDGGVDTFMRLAEEEQFNVTCGKVTKFFKCMNDAAREQFGYDIKGLARALKGNEIGKVYQLLGNVMDLVEELCSEKSQLHKDYMMDFHCVRHLNMKALEKCKKDAAAASVIFRHMDTEDSFDHAIDEPCVITAYTLGCIGADILEECGKRAFNTYKEVVKRIGIFKIGLCPPDIIQTVNSTIVDSLENLESRRSVYHAVLALKKRRK